MKRRLAIVPAAALAAAAVLAPATAGAYPAPGGKLPAPQRITHPIIVLVTRHHAIQLMQQHWWCTRDEPGLFECTPGQP